MTIRKSIMQNNKPGHGPVCFERRALSPLYLLQLLND